MSIVLNTQFVEEMSMISLCYCCSQGGLSLILRLIGLHQKSQEVNPAIIRKYLRMRSLVHCLQANPTWRSLLSERMLALSSVTDAIDGRPSPSKRIIGVVNGGLKMMMWAYSQRWKLSVRVSWPWADLWTHPRLPRSTPTHPGSDSIKSFSTGFLR